jgi:predicted GNAT family acetyltransferase
MKIVRFKDPKKFQENILETLVRREAENNLILGILANLIAGEYSEKEAYLTVFQDERETQAVSLCTPPWPVLISYENPPPNKDVLKTMLADMQETLQDDFTGLSGNREFVSPLVSLWEDGAGKKALLKMAMRIYKLEAVLPVSTVPGRMRPAETKDRNMLQDWFAGFQRDANREEPDQVRVQKQVNGYLTADPQIRGLMIWEHDEQPVSMAGYSGPTPHGIRVGAVYTPPDLRKNGYASAVTAALSQYLLDQGQKFCFLFTDLLNPTSNHIYQQIGYRPVCDVDRHLFV